MHQVIHMPDTLQADTHYSRTYTLNENIIIYIHPSIHTYIPTTKLTIHTFPS